MTSRTAFGLAALFLLCLAGCGSSSYDVTPSKDVARKSLELALGAWKQGSKPGVIEGATPPVEAVDAAWRGGRKLASYEILRDEAGEADHRFAVRLGLLAPAETAEVNYVVIGKGPVWVYRQEDYDRMINMDNNPGPAKKKRR